MSPLFYVFLLSLFICSCSTTSWVVVNEEETDRSDYEVLNTEYFFEGAGNISPENPELGIQFKAVNTLRYTQRIKTERFVQQYKPRIAYVLAGAAGAGLSYYAAFSDNLIKTPSDPQKYALAGTGSALLMLSFLNMDPVGEPVKTGESRMLRKSGNITEIDTADAVPYSNEPAFLTISYNEEVLHEEARAFQNGRLNINFVEEINAENLDPYDDEPLTVRVEYEDVEFYREVPVSSVFEKFAVVSARITALRNSPEIDPNNILTDLGQGSQLRLVSDEGEWSKVMYGISENWVLSKDVYTILRPSEFASDLSVITVANVPFGSVDVEQNIPVRDRQSFGSAGVIISNHTYAGELSERIYADRDAQLMETYLNRSLGIREQKIVRADNIQDNQQYEQIIRRISNTTTESDSMMTVYLNGYAEIRGSAIYLLGSNEGDDETRLLDLHRLFESINQLSLKSLVVFADLDFVDEEENQAALNELAEIITQKIPDSAVIFSSNPDQRSGIYASNNGEQNRHSIFTYYLAEAIKNGNLTVRSVFNHLERNVSFTSRRLYDRPQNISIYGNPDIRLRN